MPATAPSLLLSAFCAVMPSLAVMASNWMPAAMAATALLAGLALWRDPSARARLAATMARGRPGWTAVLAVLLLAWAAIASFWTFEVERALFLALRLTVLAAIGAFLLALALGLTREQRRRAGRWLVAGFVTGVALFLFERLTGSALHFLLANPDPDRSVLSTLNRGATGLTLLVWPVTAWLLRARLGRAALALPAALFVLLLFSESQAAILGTAAGLAMTLLALLVPRVGRLATLALLVLSILAAPLIAKQIYTPDAYSAGWIERNAQHRLHIWNFVADRVLERPLLGWGFDASHAMPAAGVQPFDNERRPLPAHPHNAALQIWLELGLVGVVLAIGLLFAMLRDLERLRGTDRALATGLVVAALSVASVSYGIWQSQWIAALLGVAIATVALRAEAGSDETRERS